MTTNDGIHNMAKQVVMPQMGESVAEGTIVRWLKKVGEAVERDEPLFEISTDKVDAEIPSPSAGVLSDVKVKEGETVPINTVVAVIDEAAAKPAAPQPAATPAKPAKAPQQTAAISAPEPASGMQAPPTDGDSASQAPANEGDSPRQSAAPSAPTPVAPPAPAAPRAPAARQAPADRPAAPAAGRPWSAAEARELRLSPVVRKIARDHHVDVRNIAGTGAGGRVTRNDILAYLDAGAPAAAAEPAAGKSAAASAPLLPPNPAATAGLDPGKYERTPMSVMRRKIAEHMVMSKRTSPHVHSAFEIDFTKVDEIRKARKCDYEKGG